MGGFEHPGVSGAFGANGFGFSWIQGALGWVRASGGAVGLRAGRGDRLGCRFL